jgi:hypothetical protein
MSEMKGSAIDSVYTHKVSLTSSEVGEMPSLYQSEYRSPIKVDSQRRNWSNVRGHHE